jgi:sugar phosphate isomerase/epimerase
MRFGGPVFGWSNPEEWVAAHRAKGYRTAYCPVDERADEATIRDYVATARAADIIIAEVGAWVNVLDSDEEKRRQNIEFCKARLQLADQLDARCCVNISGSRGTPWDGPDALNYAPETLDMVVETVREIVDAVRPTRAKYSLETMPWMIPDSTESALEVLKAVDRPSFGIHYDPINLVSSPKLYFQTGAMVEEFVDKVGPHIVSVHLKDSMIDTKLTVQIREVVVGAGGFDLRGFLSCVHRRLDADMPVLLEHLTEPSEYEVARNHVVGVAADIGVPL